MKTLKFSSDNPREKEFVQELKKRVSFYFKENKRSMKGNLHLFVKAFILFGFYLTPFIVIILFQPAIHTVYFLFILMGIGEAGIGMSVMHDAAHGAFSSKKWVNQLFASSIYLLGSNAFNWRIQHNILHHTYTNIYGYDQDIATKATLRLCQHAPLRKFHKFQYLYAYFFYGLMTVAKLITDFTQLHEFNRSGMTKKQGKSPVLEMSILIGSKLLYFFVLLVIPLWVTSYHWYELLIGFLILHLVAGSIMSTIFQMAHVVEGAKQPLPNQQGEIPNEWEVHQLLTTSDFAQNNLFLAWYAGGLNFQIEHHLFPHASHIHYPKIASIVATVASEYGIPYNVKPSFGKAFRSHAKRLKELGQTVSI
jgi:linoleoyl-CoA desaturase